MHEKNAAGDIKDLTRAKCVRAVCVCVFMNVAHFVPLGMKDVAGRTL